MYAIRISSSFTLQTPLCLYFIPLHLFFFLLRINIYFSLFLVIYWKEYEFFSSKKKQKFNDRFMWIKIIFFNQFVYFHFSSCFALSIFSVCLEFMHIRLRFGSVSINYASFFLCWSKQLTCWKIKIRRRHFWTFLCQFSSFPFVFIFNFSQLLQD